jgi:large-conductance mechanosensitive channel
MPVIFVIVNFFIICQALFVVVMVYTECTTVLCERFLENFFEATCETKKSMSLHLEIMAEKSVQR